MSEELQARIEAYAERLAAEAPPLDPTTAQFQRLRAVLAPAHERAA